jgi:hypothetical protein
LDLLSRLVILALPSVLDHFGAADEKARINAERPSDEAENDDGANPEMAGAYAGAAAKAAALRAAGRIVAAHIFYIVGTAEIFPTHLTLPFLTG